MNRKLLNWNNSWIGDSVDDLQSCNNGDFRHSVLDIFGSDGLEKEEYFLRKNATKISRKALEKVRNGIQVLCEIQQEGQESTIIDT